VTAFFSELGFSSLALSPDGARLALLHSRGPEDSIVIRSLPASGDEGAAAASTRGSQDMRGAGDTRGSEGTRGAGLEEWVLHRERRGARGTAASRGIRVLGWADDEMVVYSVQSPLRVQEKWDRMRVGAGERGNVRRKRGIGVRARKTRLFSIGLDGTGRYLARSWPSQENSGIQDSIANWLPQDPMHFLIDFRGRAVRVRADNGATRVLAKDQDEGASWYADHLGRVRAGVDFERWSTERTLLARRREGDSWQSLIRFDPYSQRGMSLAGFSEDPDRIYVYSNAETGRTAVYEYDLARGALGRRLFDDPVYDVDTGRLLYSRKDGRLLAVTYYAEGLRRQIVDPEWDAQWEVVRQAFPDLDVHVVDSDALGSRILLMTSSDRRPPTIHLFEPETGRLERLLDKYPALSDREFAAMESVRFRARDGRSIHGYLTRPAGAGDAPGPTIVYPHDGPATRNVIRWDPVVQFLASRGFTVFQFDYRGSAGYGMEHERAGDRQWGGAVVDDVTDGVRWLIEEGVADPDRIGIFGSGFGGYQALMGLVRAPDLYRAAASFGAPTDLHLVLDNSAAYPRRRVRDARLIGTDGPRLDAASPLRHAGLVRAPVLLAHGSEDPIFHIDHLERMAAALEQTGAEVESYRYSGEIQHFLDERNRSDFFRRVAAFFERHLRSEGDASKARASARAGIDARAAGRSGGQTRFR
jgi:dipeptidyl aminopeptidase/acylaminoacyl peptidase